MTKQSNDVKRTQVLSTFTIVINSILDQYFGDNVHLQPQSFTSNLETATVNLDCGIVLG